MSERTADKDALDLLERMHLDAVANGDWEGAARLAEAIEARVIPPAETEAPMSDETTEAGVGEREGCHRGYPWCNGKRPCACPCHDPATPGAGDASEVEALAKALLTRHPDGYTAPLHSDYARRLVAETLLASDWLAAREAAARADERERIARRLETEWRTFSLAGHEAGVVAARIARSPR